MKITLITPMRNEEFRLPFYFRHYNPIVDEIRLYDNGSNDRSLQLAKANPKVILAHFGDPASYSTRAQDEIRRHAYKRFDADWFIVADVDELLWHPTGLRGYLKRCLSQQITLPKVCGYNMLSEKLPRDDGHTPITDLIKVGIEDRRFCSKRAVFHRSLDIGYAAAAHECNPQGPVKESPTEEIKLLHYKWLSYDFAMGRMRERADRLSKDNIVHGWSPTAAQLGDELWRGRFAQMLEIQGKVIP